MRDLFTEAVDAGEGDRRAALCIVVNTKGSTPRKSGAKMIVYEDGSISGTIGGGALEERTIRDAVAAIQEGNCKLIRHDLLHQHNMCCGGITDIYIEPLARKDHLYIFGAGHTGQALAALAVNYNFEIFLIDSRYDYVHQCTDSRINKMNLPYKDAVQSLPFSDRSYTCIMTHDHAIDRELLAYCIQRPFAYLGMIGSKRKCELTKKLFREGMNISDELLTRINMPMGLDIGAEGPAEIALSILSGLIKVKNRVESWPKELQL